MKLHLNTVSPQLWESLQLLMRIEEFNAFRIVGGTSLSLQLGHRESIDIDLFTDAEYGSINFNRIDEILNENFAHVDSTQVEIIGMGKSYFIGNNKNELVKLDIFYTDTYIFPYIEEENVRFATMEEIAAMKLEVIGNGGRKKDFWDIHELLDQFTLEQMIDFYLKRYPYNHTREQIIDKLTDFSVADTDFTPNCFREKDWDIIKLDFIDLQEELNNKE